MYVNKINKLHLYGLPLNVILKWEWEKKNKKKIWINAKEFRRWQKYKCKYM